MIATKKRREKQQNICQKFKRTQESLTHVFICQKKKNSKTRLQKHIIVLFKKIFTIKTWCQNNARIEHTKEQVTVKIRHYSYKICWGKTKNGFWKPINLEMCILILKTMKTDDNAQNVRQAAIFKLHQQWQIQLLFN